MAEYTVTTDLFALPGEDGRIILYAPLAGFACKVDEDTMRWIAELDTRSEPVTDGPEKDVLDMLIRRNIVNGSRGMPQSIHGDFTLMPDKLALFLTGRCNLDCLYCYGRGRAGSVDDMPRETAFAALNGYLKRLEREEKTLCMIEFHGGGEPFTAWPLMKDVVEEAEYRCGEKGIGLEVYAGTNGMLTPEQRKWVVRHMTSLTVSFDGPPHIQNLQRPGLNGAPSFPRADETLRFFDREKLPYAVRCTVSGESQSELEVVVNYLMDHYAVRIIFVEPMHTCRRSQTAGALTPPDMELFADQFVALEETCRTRNVRLVYSGAIFERLVSHFCYVGTNNFAVTPDGFLTGCWEVADSSHPLSDRFLFGRLRADGSLEIDSEKLASLRALSVENLPFCQDCFAKWHCAGGCPMRRLREGAGADAEDSFCRTTRRLIAHQIRRLAEETQIFQKIA